jgi:hypothetical protein
MKEAVDIPGSRCGVLLRQSEEIRLSLLALLATIRPITELNLEGGFKGSRVADIRLPGRRKSLAKQEIIN